MFAHQIQEKFKICTGACPAVLRFRAGSLDVGDAPASNNIIIHIMELEYHHYHHSQHGVRTASSFTAWS
jgi:hypothetical protein